MPSYRVLIRHQRVNSERQVEDCDYEQIVDRVRDGDHACDNANKDMRIKYLKNDYPDWQLVESLSQKNCQVERLREREQQLQAEDEAQRKLAERDQQQSVHKNEKSNFKRYLLIVIILIVVLAMLSFIVFGFYTILN